MPLSPALDTSDGLSGLLPISSIAARPAPSGRTAAAMFAQPLAPMLTASAVTVLVVLAIQMGRTADMIVPLWGAGAVAVGVWLRSGRGFSFDLSFGGVIAVGIMAGEFLAGNSMLMSGMFTVANMIEIVCAVALARRFAPSLSLSSVGEASRFILIAALLAPVPAALFASTMLYLDHAAPLADSFQIWWFGHALGLTIVTPMLLAVDPKTTQVFRQPLKMLEWAVLLALLSLCAWVAYFRFPLPLSFMAMPVLLLIAVRLRIPGVSAAMIIMAFCSVTSVLQREVPIWDVSLSLRVMMSQLTLLFASIPFILVASLLDERDRLIGRTRAAQMRAEKASQAKSRLLANVAHEIKSPVGGVIGIAELWSGGQLGPITPTQKEMADMLVKTARQVETLAHDLLDVARAESGAVKVELRPTDVVVVIEDIRRALSIRADAASIRTEAVFDVGSLIAVADAQRLTQVIDNFATNALKYGASGEVVIFRVRRVGGDIRIEVSDKGPGLSPEKQAQLFEPFNRLGLERSTVEGHGIGLALAKRLVELQGGKIGVVSTVGEGATFWIELPAA